MRPFARATARYGRTPEPETPYQRAGQIWDERIGSARVQARNWRLMAFGCLGLALAASGGLAWRAGTATVTPWVVQVDRLGRVQAAGPASSGWRPSDAQVAYHLAQFVGDVRGVPADPVVLRQQWLRAYAYARGDAARSIGEYARDADPFGRLAREQVTVEVASVVRASPASFRVEWTERRYAAGALQATERWTAILAVELDPPRTVDALRANPLGLHIISLAWSKEFT